MRRPSDARSRWCKPTPARRTSSNCWAGADAPRVFAGESVHRIATIASRHAAGLDSYAHWFNWRSPHRFHQLAAAVAAVTTLENRTFGAPASA